MNETQGQLCGGSQGMEVGGEPTLFPVFLWGQEQRHRINRKRESGWLPLGSYLPSCLPVFKVVSHTFT